MELLIYFLKVSACTGLFFAFYVLVLRKLTFFKINRFYLLSALILSFTIPTLHFTFERIAVQAIEINTPMAVQDIDLDVQGYQTPITVGATPAEESFDYYSLLPFLYLSIAGCLLIFASWRLFQLIKHTRNSVEEINGLKLVSKRKGFTNCSFFNYVFIDQNNLSFEELKVLLRHEAVHAKQYHSIDKIILMLAKAVLWFNPIIYLYDKALEEVHEYEADETTSMNFGSEPYANLLLKLAVNGNSMPLVHNFVKSPIKKRIKMLFNSKSKKMKKLMYLLALPIGLCLVWAFATEVVYAQNKNGQVDQEVTQTTPFIKRTIVNKDGRKMETIIVTVRNKAVSKIYASNTEKLSLVIYIDGKIYTEAEALKFTPEFIAKLSSTNGSGPAKNQYNIPGLAATNDQFVVWFGKEPPLSAYAAKNKSYYEKYNGKTVEGKIAGFTYSPTTKIINGFLVNVNGETLRANVEAKFAKQTAEMIKDGDEVSIKIYNSAYWKDSEYPVLTSYKISKGGKLLYDRWPKTTTVKVTVNGIKDVDVPAEIDGGRVKLIAVKPILISSSALTVNAKIGVTYIKNGVMKIAGDQLEAETITWSEKNEILIARNAVLKTQKGNIIKSEQFIFSLKTGTYQTDNTTGLDHAPSPAYSLISNLSFQATDSIKVNRILNTMILHGNIKLNIDGFLFNAKFVQVDRNSNVIKAHQAHLTTNTGVNVSANLIKFDYATKKYTLSDGPID